MQILINPTTGAAQSESFRVSPPNMPVSLSCSGLASGETADVEIYIGTDWILCQDHMGNSYQFTDAVTFIPLWAPGEYRVNKGATASAVGVQMHAPADS